MTDDRDQQLIIRRMEQADARIFTEALTAQGWHPDINGYLSRLSDQAEGKCAALTAVYGGCPAGYVYVYFRANDGPFRDKGWPIIVDFNVLRKFQRRGIGSRLMDEAERVRGHRLPRRLTVRQLWRGAADVRPARIHSRRLRRVVSGQAVRPV